MEMGQKYFSYPYRRSTGNKWGKSKITSKEKTSNNYSQNILIIFFCIFFFESCSVFKSSTKSVKIEQEKNIENVEKIKIKKEIFQDNIVDNYLNKYAPIAKIEMKKFKIPASITLAQGLLESGMGKGRLANEANNHFGIKCHKQWKGERIYHDDDKKQECFRKYGSPSESFRDHSLFLKNRVRYSFLFKLNIKDYKAWAKGLKKAGYATDPKYPDKLISLIERFRLDQFDSKVNENKIKILNKNFKIHNVKTGDTLYSISKKYQITLEELISENDLNDNNIFVGQELIIPNFLK